VEFNQACMAEVRMKSLVHKIYISSPLWFQRNKTLSTKLADDEKHPSDEKHEPVQNANQ
jgi:hypothetical protein